MVGDVTGNDSGNRVAGLIGSSNTFTVIEDSFFLGSVFNDSASNISYGITNSASATLTNVYWNDSAAGTEAVDCHDGGNTGCTIENDPTQFYLPSYPVYTRSGFEWDFVNIWQVQSSALPILRN